MTSEQEWADDKQRFLADDAEQQLAQEQGRPVMQHSVRSGAPSGALAQEFASLAETLFAAETVEDILQLIIQAATNVVPGTDLASVTLVDFSGNFQTPVETAPLATRLDELQYKSDEGPCLEATRTSGTGVSFSSDLRTDGQWPVFGPAAAKEGALSVLATGLFPEGMAPRLGSLNLYSQKENGLDEASRTAALLLASHASIALASTQAIAGAELKSTQLEQALQSRDVIGQAKGVLMERRGISAEDAFDMLRHSSQDLNIKLATVAEIVATRRSEL